MKTPMISVIMSVYNDEKYLSKAVESILNQSYKDFEFIIVNDGSTDNSFEILEKYQQDDKRVILIEQDNIGLTKSLNKAIDMACGKYIARMDSDDISLSTRFQKQLEFLEQNKDYALVGTNILKIDVFDNELEVNETKYSYKDICETFKIRNCIAHGSIMVNKELLGGLFHYDEEFLYAQDFRLWTKMAKQYKIANLEDVLYKLRIHDNSISNQKIEQQSIYAGVVSYEFNYNTIVKNIKDEIVLNKKLREKIGMVLLMNYKPSLALKYFQIISKYYWLALVMNLVDLRFLKNMLKKFI